jgi:hypothetical protein
MNPMLNTTLIKEECFEASSNPTLMAALLKYRPALEKDIQKKPFIKTCFHVVYLDLPSGPKIVYSRGFNRPLEIPQTDFKTRLEKLPQITFDEVCFLLATYGDAETPHFNDKVDWNTVPEKLKKCVLPTRGYLLFEEQGYELYRQCIDADNQAAFKWVEQVKKFSKEAWPTFLSMATSEMPEDDLKNLFLNAEIAPYFKTKPTYETYDILSLISENHQIVEEYDTWLHLRQSGFLIKEEQEELFCDDELLKAKLKKDVLGNFRIAFWLKNEIFHIDQEIEIGLNYEYATLNNISDFMGQYIEPSNHQFIIDLPATIELPDKSDYFSLYIKANFNFALPEELKKNKMVYKLYN